MPPRLLRAEQDLTKAELLAHRKAASAARPSLPQCAGRTYWHFMYALQEAGRHFEEKQAEQPTDKKGEQRIFVHAVLRPDPDIKAIAQVILDLARSQTSGPL